MGVPQNQDLEKTAQCIVHNNNFHPMEHSPYRPVEHLRLNSLHVLKIYIEFSTGLIFITKIDL